MHRLIRTVTANLFSISQTVLIVLLVVLAVVFVVVMLSENPKRIFSLLGLAGKTEPKFEALKFLGIGMGGVLLAIQAQMSYKRAKAMEDTAKAQADAVLKTEQGQRQERLKNAIEHLGNEADSVRLGGAYELFHLAQDTAELRQTVLDILCAHIRQTTGGDEYRKNHKSKPSEEIQSLLTLLFVQKHETFKGCHINLQESWLNGADLKKARFAKARLSKAHLRRADLEEVNLEGGWLPEINLQGANLWGANLQEAELTEAYLQGAELFGVNLQGADLWGANLQGAELSEAGPYLIEANLQGANLFEVNLQGADLGGTQLQGANLAKAQLQGAYFREVQLQGAYLGNVQFQGAGCGYEENLSDIFSFKQRVRRSIDQESDLSGIIFSGRLSREEVDSIVKDLNDEKANELREKLTSHIGQPESNQLPQDSGAITGSYTKEEAEQWIAEYEQAMSEVPEDDS